MLRAKACPNKKSHEQQTRAYLESKLSTKTGEALKRLGEEKKKKNSSEKIVLLGAAGQLGDFAFSCCFTEQVATMLI
jgi:hypothetical protein